MCVPDDSFGAFARATVGVIDTTPALPREIET